MPKKRLLILLILCGLFYLMISFSKNETSGFEDLTEEEEEGQDKGELTDTFEVHVQSGSSSEAPQGDRICASLEEAVQKTRENRKGSSLRQRILLKNGEHRVSSSIVLRPEDAGLLIEGESRADVVISGGITLDHTKFTPVEEKDLPELPPTIRKYVVKADLAALGLDDTLLKAAAGQEGMPMGFGFPVIPARPEIFFNDSPLRLARYPNVGYMMTGGVHHAGDLLNDETFAQGASFGAQNVPHTKFMQWKTQANLWAFGYWKFDWADQTSRIRVNGPDSLELQDPTYYGVKSDSRFIIFNSPHDLDYPGEYYIQEGILYLYPPEKLGKSTKVVLSLMTDPILSLMETHAVRIQKLTLEATRGTAVQVIGGQGATLKSLIIRNVGNIGIIFGEGSDGEVVGRFGGSARDLTFSDTTWQRRCGTSHLVDKCRIYNIGFMGVILGGGDRLTLTPGFNEVRRSNIYHFSRLSTTYRPGIWLEGVGNVVQRNKIHHAPHSGILFWGNEHTIERNELYNLVSDTSDAGFIYTGRDFTARGTRIASNLFYRSPLSQAQGVYLDDFASGIVVQGNIFYNISRALIIGGGQDNIFANNIVLGCNKTLLVDSRGLNPKYSKHFAETGDVTVRYNKIPVDSPEWTKLYPQLNSVWNQAGERYLPHNNVVRNNIFAFSRAASPHSLRISAEAYDLGTIGPNLIYGEKEAQDKRTKAWLLKDIEDSLTFQPDKSARVLAAIKHLLGSAIAKQLPEFNFDAFY